MKSEHSQKNYQDIKTYQLLILPYKCFGLTVKFSAVRGDGCDNKIEYLWTTKSLNNNLKFTSNSFYSQQNINLSQSDN